MRNTKRKNVTPHFRDFKISRENMIRELFKILRSSNKICYVIVLCKYYYRQSQWLK